MKWLEKSRRGTHEVRIPFVMFIAMIFAIAAMTAVLWSMWSSHDVHLRVGDNGDLNALLPSIVGLTQSSLDAGNRAQLLQNGDGYFPPVLRDIANAKESVHVESYIWWKGDICRQIAAALSAKARQGVEVRLLVDASGGSKMDKNLEKEMADAGVKLATFHPFTISNLGHLNNRDHRKMFIIDGRIGYIGGYGIASEWTGHAQDKKHFRDTGLRMEGPVVNRMQGAFCENWVEQTGEVVAGEKYFPKLPPVGPTSAHVAYTSPTGGISSVQVLYYLAIHAAKHEIIIQNPYMLPDDNAIAALREAVRRGVDVKIMVPSTEATDSPIVQHASHHDYATLLADGVKIYEYKKTLLHQKVIVVDGVWACLGSTNFDDRSFQLNDEISIGLIDPLVAAQLRAAFADDLRFAQQRNGREWAARGLWHKMIDALAYAGHSQL